MFLLYTAKSESEPCLQYIEDLCSECSVKPERFNKGLIKDKITKVKYDEEGARIVDGKHKYCFFKNNTLQSVPIFIQALYIAFII